MADDLVFVGLLETYRSADDYFSAFIGLLQVTVRLKVKTIIAEADEAAIFFRVGDKGAHVESAFDGRPFAAMFTGAQP